MMWTRAKAWLSSLLPPIGTANQLTRDAWIASTLRDLPAGGRILDAGAGTQPYRRYCEHLEYVSQDFGAYDGRGDQTGMQTGTFVYGKLDHVCDILAIPEPDESFDAILCSEVLEHIPDPARAFGEFARLLRPGGRLIVTSPFCSATHFAPYHFSTGFSRYYYEHHLSLLGFRILSLTPNGDFYSYLAQELRRLPLLAGSYNQRRIGLVSKVAIVALLGALAKLNRSPNCSHEFLCFGYHVMATKPDGRPIPS